MIKITQSQKTEQKFFATPLPESGKAGETKKPRSFSNISRSRKWVIFSFILFVTLGAFGATLKYLEDDARRQTATGQLKNVEMREKSFLSIINPFLTAAAPASTPQLSKEYIYAGDKLLAVEDAGANGVPPADLAVWRPGNGTWYVMGGQGSQQIFLQWGMQGDAAAPGDFDGDGKTDFSVFRPASGHWYIQKSSDNALISYQFGQSGDQLAQADYDGDGRTDTGVFRNGYWYILRSSDAGFIAISYGTGTDKPTPADFDGDGKADAAVWRGSTNTFYVQNSSNGVNTAVQMGTTDTDTPVPADYDGDGRADHAVRSGNNWLILNSLSGQPQTIGWQQATDKAVPNDYDGDGKVDIAVWRESNGTWYIRNSSDNLTRIVQWGTVGDIPVPAFYRR